MPSSLAHHVDCAHALGHCTVFPGAVVVCPHGVVQASCEHCLNVMVDLEVQLALMDEGGMVRQGPLEAA